MRQATIHIEGMSCSHCLNAVNRAYALRQEIDKRLASGANGAAGVTQAASSETAALKSLRQTLLDYSKRMVPLFYGRGQYVPVYTATILEELQGLGYGDSDTSPNAVEQSAAQTMVTAAHDEVARFNAAVQSQLATVNEQLKSRGQQAISY